MIVVICYRTNSFFTEELIFKSNYIYIYIYIHTEEEEGNAKKERKRKEIGTWEGEVVDRHQHCLHKTYEGVEIASYLIQFHTEFRKLLLHRHTNTSSPRKNSSRSLSLSLAHRDSTFY